jgi:glucose-1-phosphate adenylyltransferase
VFQNISILENTAADTAIILSADHVYKMDYRDLLRFHTERGAAVTLAALEYPCYAASQFGVLETDPEGYATAFEEKPKHPIPIRGRPYDALVSMGAYVFNLGTLVDVLRQDARENTNHDFGKDIIPGLVGSRRVSVYNFTERGTRLGSYWRDIGTLDAYYRMNMELLLNSFFDPYVGAGWPLYGFDASDGRRFGQAGRRATNLAIHSGIPEGVLLGSGSQVVHSVLSPGVEIGDSSEVHSSILMHGVQLGAGVRIRRAIIDENVRIGDGVQLGFDMTRDRKHGFLTDSGILVIPADTDVGSKAFPQVQ